MLGCKYKVHCVKPLLEYELIDTCWDVNNSCMPNHKLRLAELIDTCWDVNNMVLWH